MCGIAGLIDPDLGADALAATAARMGDTIAHRGPDGSGVWCDAEAGIGLAHRRLAIVDLSEAGRQPMISADGRWVVTYNGELYDAPERRPELEAAGHCFAGHSDTEVLVELIARHGVAGALERLDGLFAFAAWDRRERTLWLARDRFGIKPLYWSHDGRRTLFGSELRAILAHPEARPGIDRNAAASMLRFGYVPAPATILKGVRKLGPGELLRLRSGEEARVESYWSVAGAMRQGATHPFAGEPGEAVERLATLLGDAVRRQLMSDVPLGAFLSGGIDSSVVVALMSRSAARPRTFTIGFSNGAFDESGHAEAIARHLGTDHTTITVGDREALDVVPRLAEIYDEPFADPSQVPTHVVSAVTRRHVTVALSGDGGDELFAGYDRYAFASRFAGQVERVPAPVRRAVSGAVGALPQSAVAALAQAMPAAWRGTDPADRVRKIAEILPLDGFGVYRRLVTLNPDWRALAMGAEGVASPLDGDPVADGTDGLLQRMRYLDCMTYLPDDILAKVDRASMAVALETRVPILDRQVAEFAWSLPPDLLVRGGTSKWLLKEVLARHVPRALWDRPKHGFGVPLAQWLRGPLKAWAQDLLAGADLGGGFLDRRLVRAKLEAHLSGAANNAYSLWAILMFESWRRRWA